MNTLSAPPAVNVEIKLDRFSSTYRPNEMVRGSVVLTNNRSTRLTVTDVSILAAGYLKVKPGTKPGSINESLGREIQPICLFKHSAILASDKFVNERDPLEISFEFALSRNQNEDLLETYSGVYIMANYDIRIEVKNGFELLGNGISPLIIINQELSKELAKRYPKIPRSYSFVLKNDKSTDGSGMRFPKFRIPGAVVSDICVAAEDFEGYVVIEECDTPIVRAELQLVRIEALENRSPKFLEATQIQNTQIIEGEPLRNIEIPFYTILPVEFSCMNFSYKGFKVDFEFNVIFYLQGGFRITQNIPITILRTL